VLAETSCRAIATDADITELGAIGS